MFVAKTADKLSKWKKWTVCMIDRPSFPDIQFAFLWLFSKDFSYFLDNVAYYSWC